MDEKDQNSLGERAVDFPQQPADAGSTAGEIVASPRGADAVAADDGQFGTLSGSDKVPDEVEKEGGPLPIVTLSQVRRSYIDAMSFPELDSFISSGVGIIAINEASVMAARKAMVPAILRMHDALSRRGKRTDLLDAPAGLTFGEWLKTKEDIASRSTFYRLLREAGLQPEKQFAEGTRVKVKGRGEAGVVAQAHDADGGVPKYEVLFEGEEKAVTVPAENLVKVSVRKVAVGDLIFVEDMAAEFRYAGSGKFLRTQKADAAGTGAAA